MFRKTRRYIPIITNRFHGSQLKTYKPVVTNRFNRPTVGMIIRRKFSYTGTNTFQRISHYAHVLIPRTFNFTIRNNPKLHHIKYFKSRASLKQTMYFICVGFIGGACGYLFYYLIKN